MQDTSKKASKAVHSLNVFSIFTFHLSSRTRCYAVFLVFSVSTIARRMLSVNLKGNWSRQAIALLGQGYPLALSGKHSCFEAMMGSISLLLAKIRSQL